MGAMSFTSSAQKIGYMDFSTVLLAHPAYDSVAFSLQNLERELQMQLEEQNAAFEKSYQDLVNYSQTPGYDTSLFLMKKRTVESQQETLKRSQEIANETYEKRKTEELKKIIDRIRVVVDAIAKEKGLLYVMDNSSKILIVKDPAGDITKDVMKRMGIAIPPSLNE